MRITMPIRETIRWGIKQSALRGTRYARTGVPWLRCLGSETGYTPFIILGTGRTGSNLLKDLLNSHPQILAYGEEARNLSGRTANAIIDPIFSSWPLWIRAVGFKVFYHHPQDETGNAFWRTLATKDRLHVIHLKRRNIMRQLVSLRLAQQSDQYLQRVPSVRFDDARQVKQLTITPKEAEAWFERIRSQEKKYDSFFPKTKTYSIYYENLAKHPELEMKGIFNFLNVKATKTFSLMKRQNPEPLATLVKNFDELQSHFCNSRWSEFF